MIEIINNSSISRSCMFPFFSALWFKCITIALWPPSEMVWQIWSECSNWSLLSVYLEPLTAFTETTVQNAWTCCCWDLQSSGNADTMKSILPNFYFESHYNWVPIRFSVLFWCQVLRMLRLNLPFFKLDCASISDPACRHIWRCFVFLLNVIWLVIYSVWLYCYLNDFI